MKHCLQCNRITSGEPLFCSFCGSTYDVKLCPRLHVNSRAAEICSQCGSRDLSTPQPKVSLWTKIMWKLIAGVLGVLVVAVSIAVALVIIESLLEQQQVQAEIVVLVILLLILWWSWIQFPASIRNLIYRSLKRREKKESKQLRE